MLKITNTINPAFKNKIKRLFNPHHPLKIYPTIIDTESCKIKFKLINSNIEIENTDGRHTFIKINGQQVACYRLIIDFKPGHIPEVFMKIAGNVYKKT